MTGASGEPMFEHEELFGKLADLNAPPPVLGFGISKPEHVRSGLASGAAGAISGTAIVNAAQQGGSDVVRQLVRELKQATRHRAEKTHLAMN